jgi:hypothetical protein
MKTVLTIAALYTTAVLITLGFSLVFEKGYEYIVARKNKRNIV